MDKAFVVDIALERGIPLPSFVYEEPTIYPSDEFYLSAFWELSTCRSLGMSVGPIPWRDVLHFAQYSGLDDETVPIFNRVIRQMDHAYIEYLKGKESSG